ncbi:MAG TPA: YcgN family cysteine cluster protein [Rhizobiaceae bacterium]|mgnify:CR=1 FL=1|nr:YcgN family cysteine cluster protein [Rhizobiaceae bacterium]
MSDRFWETKSLAEMTPAEWEALCDGCGKCCLIKLEDEDAGAIAWTSAACRLFDAHLCRCTRYAERHQQVPDCIALTPENVLTIPWLPQTCAYKLVAEGRPLPDWHHLVSGDRDSLHAAKASMRGRITLMEQDVEDDEEYLEHVIEEGL